MQQAFYRALCDWISLPHTRFGKASGRFRNKCKSKKTKCTHFCMNEEYFRKIYTNCFLSKYCYQNDFHSCVYHVVLFLSFLPTYNPCFHHQHCRTFFMIFCFNLAICSGRISHAILLRYFRRKQPDGEHSIDLTKQEFSHFVGDISLLGLSVDPKG